MVRSLYFGLFYRVFFAAVAGAATFLTLFKRTHNTLIYYTTWSVWLTTAMALCALSESIRLLLDGRKNGEAYRVLKFTATVTIAVTFVMSAVALPDKPWTAGYWAAGSLFKHFLLPIAAVVDEALFCESYEPYYAYVALVPSCLYWAAIMSRIFLARALFGGVIPAALAHRYYPYPFTYIDGGVDLGFLFTLLALIGAGMLFCGSISVLLSRRKRTAYDKSF